MRERIPVSEPSLTPRAKEYVLDCLDSGWISSQGPYVERLEREFAAVAGVAQSVAVSNGTAALHLALLAAGIGPGDEVIVPDLTFAATANVVLHVGAVPVLVDVDPGTWCLTPELVAEAITERTRAIMIVHLYSNCVDLTPFRELTRGRDILLIEDAAEAMGSRCHGAFVGTQGDLGCYSMFANKVVTAGEGGIVVGRDEELLRRVRLFRDHGMRPERRYWHEVGGLNYRLTNLQAAVAVSQLESLSDFLTQRRRIRARYDAGLSHLPGLRTQQIGAACEPACWLYSFTVDPVVLTSEALRAALAEAGIETRAFFHPLHIQPPYRSTRDAFTASTSVAANGVSLPTYVALGDDDIDRICALVGEAIEGAR